MSAALQKLPDDSEILFHEGIIGVPRARRFQLLERPGSSVRVLRCQDIAGFALPVIDPFEIDPGYKPRLSKRILDALGFGKEDRILMLAVATLDGDRVVANLRAPLLVNVEQRIAAQVILDAGSFPLRAEAKVQVRELENT